MSNPREMIHVYQATVVTVWNPVAEGVGVDPATVAQQRGEQAIVLTAWNPGDARWTPTQNDQANDRMREVLIATGLPVWNADGADPEGSFCEPGFCVWSMSVDQGLAIARQFDQFAIYVYRPTGVRDIAWTEDGSVTTGFH